MGVLFSGVVAPLGFTIRPTGKDPLRLKLEPGADSYRIPREPPGPPPDSLTNQFKEITMSIIKELWLYMRVRKKFWLLIRPQRRLRLRQGTVATNVESKAFDRVCRSR